MSRTKSGYTVSPRNFIDTKIDSLLSMRLTLPKVIHYTIKDRKFIKNIISIDEIIEKNI